MQVASFHNRRHGFLTGGIVLAMVMVQVVWGLWMPAIRPCLSWVMDMTVDMLRSLICFPLRWMWVVDETPGSDSGVPEEIYLGGMEGSVAPSADGGWEPPDPLEGMVWEG